MLILDRQVGMLFNGSFRECAVVPFFCVHERSVTHKLRVFFLFLYPVVVHCSNIHSLAHDNPLHPLSLPLPSRLVLPRLQSEDRGSRREDDFCHLTVIPSLPGEGVKEKEPCRGKDEGGRPKGCIISTESKTLVGQSDNKFVTITVVAGSIVNPFNPILLVSYPDRSLVLCLDKTTSIGFAVVPEDYENKDEENLRWSLRDLRGQFWVRFDNEVS